MKDYPKGSGIVLPLLLLLIPQEMGFVKEAVPLDLTNPQNYDNNRSMVTIIKNKRNIPPNLGEKLRAACKRHYFKNREKRKAEVAEYRLKIKIEVLTYYSNGKLACVRCGENQLPCLSIDHINGNGYQHRKEVSPSYCLGAGFYNWLKRESFPIGYQTLCMNCQFIKKKENREGYN